MTDAYRDDRIASWVDDFVAHPRFAAEPLSVRDHAPQILSEFLGAACRIRDVDPGEIEEADLRPALLTGVAPLALPAEVRAGAVDLVAAFLEVMQDAGRLSGGRILGKYVRAMREEFRGASAGKGTTIRKPAEKIGRNDPCPCGSGRKYKQCCLRALG